MRVLLVNDHPPGPKGGAEVHVGRLREALTDAGDAVELFAAGEPHRGVARVLDLWDPAARRRLRSLIEDFQPDVVHYHNILDELSTSVLGLGPPSVLTVHDPRVVGVRFGLDHGRSGLSPAVARRDAKNRLGRARLRRNVRATIAPSAGLADRLEAAGFPDVHHIPNFAPLAPGGPPGDEVVFVGQLSEHKGPSVLLAAFTQIADRHLGARLRLVGDGPLRGALRAAADASGLGARVHLDGAVAPAEVADALGAAALVVVPSLGVEGGGPTLAVIEAMAAGRAVVVSDRPGVTEGVDDEVGAIVPAGDVPALARTLDELLGDRGGLERRGAAARLRARTRWSAEATIPLVRSVYQRAAGLDG
jgi:glycosyltransferase involved in cell wall biosynthesis